MAKTICPHRVVPLSSLPDPRVDSLLMVCVSTCNCCWPLGSLLSCRVVPLSNLPDPRVDAALFFLSPHYLKPQDVELMSKLAKHVPVIPIIAKVRWGFVCTTSQMRLEWIQNGTKSFNSERALPASALRLSYKVMDD